MYCYNKCDKYKELSIPETEIYSVCFCSESCWEEYNKNNPQETGDKKRVLTIPEIQARLLDLGKAAGKQPKDPTAEEIFLGKTMTN